MYRYKYEIERKVNSCQLDGIFTEDVNIYSHGTAVTNLLKTKTQKSESSTEKRREEFLQLNSIFFCFWSRSISEKGVVV